MCSGPDQPVKEKEIHFIVCEVTRNQRRDNGMLHLLHSCRKCANELWKDKPFWDKFLVSLEALVEQVCSLISSSQKRLSADLEQSSSLTSSNQNRMALHDTGITPSLLKHHAWKA